ncbi:Endonuclease IV [uncultured virus]|nr:Endonuclease IV [uncultured virus]
MECCCAPAFNLPKEAKLIPVDKSKIHLPNEQPGRFLKLNVRKPQCRCGGHIPLRGSLYETVISEPSCRCIQMFMGSPTTYECRTITAEDKQRTLEYCTKTDTTFYIHAPYVANLAKPDCTKAVSIVSKELDIVSGLPAATVLHVGKVGTIENVAQRINEIRSSGHLPQSQHSRAPYHLLLEIAAGQGTELGRSWEEIRHLYEAIDTTCVGLCVNTQHAFASGMCLFQTHEDVVKLFDAANSITPSGISMIHLNDSHKEFGSHVDRHAALRTGYIWYNSDEGLKSLIRISRDYNLDLISETDNPIGDSMIVQQYIT